MLDYNYYNSWLDVSNMYKENGVNHIVNLPVDFFTNLKFDERSLKQYRIDAAKKCVKLLGNNPVLLLSGGIDSQAMVQCFVEAEIKIDIVTFVFNENLNKQDSNYARFFCKMENLKNIEIEFDVLNFLQKENYDIGIKYKSTSPHFNAHYKMAEILKDMNYTGVCCGGFTPTYLNNKWGTNFSYNPCYYVNIHDILEIPFQGNFLGYTPELAWSVSLLTEHINLKQLQDKSLSKYNKSMVQRYNTKVKGYSRHGFNVYPQPQKFTGFELIKKYYEEKTNDGWFFEKSFRMPLYQKFGKNDSHPYEINLCEKHLNDLMSIHLKNFPPSTLSTSGVTN